MDCSISEPAFRRNVLESKSFFSSMSIACRISGSPLDEARRGRMRDRIICRRSRKERIPGIMCHPREIGSRGLSSKRLEVLIPRMFSTPVKKPSSAVGRPLSDPEVVDPLVVSSEIGAE